MADEEKKADGEKKASDEKKSGGILTKVVATVFAAVVAPIIVGVALKVIPTLLSSEAKPPAKDAQTTSPAAPRDGGWVKPNLGETFYSFGWSAREKRDVRDDNVDRDLFFYDDGTKTLKAPGLFVGALVTKADYENYVLTVEYRWGDNTHGVRQGKARWGGVEVHCTGADGQLARVWMPGYEVLLHEGQVGSVDLRGAENKVKALASAEDRVAGKVLRRDYAPRMKPIEVVSGQKGVPSLVHALDTPDKIDNVPGFHPPGDPTRPGDWNTLEITCEGPTLRVKVNDKEVNVLTGLSQTRGKILIAPQHAEIAFRRIALEPLKASGGR